MADYLLISGYRELKIPLDMQILSQDLSPAVNVSFELVPEMESIQNCTLKLSISFSNFTFTDSLTGVFSSFLPYFFLIFNLISTSRISSSNFLLKMLSCS